MTDEKPDFTIELDTSEGAKRMGLYRDGLGNVTWTLEYVDGHSKLSFQHTFSAEDWIKLVASVSKTQGDSFSQVQVKALHMWEKKEE